MKREGFLKRILGSIAAAPMIAVAAASTSTFVPPAVGVIEEGYWTSYNSQPLESEGIAYISGEIDAVGAQSLMEAGFTSFVRVFEDGATSLIRPLSQLLARVPR